MMEGYALLFSREAHKFRYRQRIINPKATTTMTETRPENGYSETTKITVKPMQERLPPVETLRELEERKIEEVLDLLFEPSKSFHSLLIPEIKKSTSLNSYSDLVSLAKRCLDSLPKDSSILLSILSSHPRLGAKKVDSAQSQNEQKSLGNEIERRELEKLNEEYETQFPGLRYVVFVNGRSREVIMRDMRGRIERSTREEEILKASEAMCDIAVDRARKLGAE